MNEYKVMVIGGLGHVGFPFSLHLALHGIDVTIVDPAVRNIENTLTYPYDEPEGQDILNSVGYRITFKETIQDTNDQYDAIFVMIGTPVVDGIYDNTDLMNIAEDIKEHFRYVSCKPNIVLRSTVYPGTTRMVAAKLPEYNVYYAPERIAEGKAFEELTAFPQLIAGLNRGDEILTKIYSTCNINLLWFRLLEEAEFAKLITNMYRYVNHAFSNEVSMLVDDFAYKQGHDLNIKRIIDFANKDYPRMNMSQPGPSGGACLAKDFEFILGSSPYTGVIRSAANVNMHIPDYYLDLFERNRWDIDNKNVLVMGEAFKKNVSDTRLSPSTRLIKLLRNKGYNVTVFDPLVYPNVKLPTDKELGQLAGIFIMTNHDEFIKIIKYMMNKIDFSVTTLIDPWGMWNDYQI